METSSLKSVLSVKDLAQILNIGINGAYSLVREGQIHSVRIGRQYRIPLASLTEYLKGLTKRLPGYPGEPLTC